MMNRREAICKKIEAVKLWLVSAEQNFSNDNSLRGELDLMLAEAEMSDIKKTSPIRKRIFFSINILIIIGVFFSISFIYFVKDDIIFLKDKNIDNKTEQILVPKVIDSSEPTVIDKESTTITIETQKTAEIDNNKARAVPEINQTRPLSAVPIKSDIVEIRQQPEKVAPILTAEETREMVKLARENLRK